MSDTGRNRPASPHETQDSGRVPSSPAHGGALRTDFKFGPSAGQESQQSTAAEAMLFTLTTGEVYAKYVNEAPELLGNHSWLSRLMLEEQLLALSLTDRGDRASLEDAAHRACPLVVLDPLGEGAHAFLYELYVLFARIWETPEMSHRAVHHASVARAVANDTVIEVISSRAPHHTPAAPFGGTF